MISLKFKSMLKLKKYRYQVNRLSCEFLQYKIRYTVKLSNNSQSINDKQSCNFIRVDYYFENR